MYQRQCKKRPPPRPPPPNFSKYKSKSSFNLTQPQPPQNLIEWSPPSSPGIESNHRQFGGSVSSSYSSSASSLASSKKSLENDAPFSFSLTLNWAGHPQSPPSQSRNPWENNVRKENSSGPRIIRAIKKNEEVSTPMPQVPPPSPPKGDTEVITPYGIALFNFPATQSGDLALQVDDVVIILRRVNDDWLYGKVDDREGMFPENFIRIEVPLPGESQILTALYEFIPQMPEDLKLVPGQKIRVIKRINKDWFYGESNGQTGQFPSNFVG